MSNTLLIIGGIALVGVAYYSYQRRKSQQAASVKGPAVSKEELINQIVKDLPVEKVDNLALSDVVNYFKSLSIKKDVDTPFVATTIKDGLKSYLLATFKEETNEVANGKLISPVSVDDKLLQLLGNETFVVLS